MATAQIAAFLVIQFDIKFNLDLVLFGLAIAFPLAFSTQTAFRRRDRALEYFSRFKAGTMALHHSFRVSEDLPAEKKTKIGNILLAMNDQLVSQLEYHVPGYQPMQAAANRVLEFVEASREELSSRNVLRMIRYMRDVTESSAYLISLVTHRTMVGIRFYAITFIFVFPIVQAPILYYRLGPIVPAWALYLLLAVGSLLLVTLNNFQRMIEYPFDNKGMDNIHVRDFAPNIHS